MHLLGRGLWREGSAEVGASGRGMGTGHEEENSKQKKNDMGPTLPPALIEKKVQGDISEHGVIKCTQEVSKKGDKRGSTVSCLGHKKKKKKPLGMP